MTHNRKSLLERVFQRSVFPVKILCVMYIFFRKAQKNLHKKLKIKENHALKSISDLVENIKSKYVMISFNSEGFISMEQMLNLLKKIGKVEALEIKYNTFRGSRNLNSRKIYVKEYLYLLEK